MNVTFICLANSRKLNGRCVAGLRTDGGGWIRPVSLESSGTLGPQHYTLDNGNEAALLDVIKVAVSSPCPQLHQPENWDLGRGWWRFLDRFLGAPRWKLIDKVEPSKGEQLLSPFLVGGPNLLGNASDRVRYTEFTHQPAPASLALIEPSGVSWRITQSIRGRRQTRVVFQLDGRPYNLSVTDPKWEQRLSHLTYGLHRREVAGIAPRDRVLFTVSLGEPFKGSSASPEDEGDCFKLVAAVIVLPAMSTPG